MCQCLSSLKTNEQRCLLLECAWTQSLQAETTAPSFMQTHFLLLPGRGQPEMASHHPVQEGKAVPVETVGVELEEGMIKI